MERKSKNPLPVDISLPEQSLLPDGTIFVVLKTLAEVESFWRDHKGKFGFACQGRAYGEPMFLRPYEWVFGSTKSAVVRTVMRWDATKVGCEFYDWAALDPVMHRTWFIDRDEFRASRVAAGVWSPTDESDYLADCVRRSPETYRGWWELKNLPGACDPLDWFNPCGIRQELIDRNMPIHEVESKLQEQTFDDWKASDPCDIEYHDAESIESTILYWQNERANDQDYYGSENELHAS